MSDEQEPDSLDMVPQNPRVLKDVSDIVHRSQRPPTKMICIFLYDEDGQYETSFINAGMKSSEVISLCEVIKLRMLRMMVPNVEE